MSLPIPQYGRNDKETVDNLMDTVMKLRKELEHLLYHLGDENIPDLPVMKDDIETNAWGIEINGASIDVIEGEIEIMVQDIAGNYSAINVLSDEISLKVNKNGVIAAINLSPESISLDASRINLNGVTTMNGLAYVYNDLTLGTPYSSFARINMGTQVQLMATGGTLNIYGDTSIDGYLIADTVTDRNGLSLGSLDSRISALEGA
jgi:hypothetical protein